MTQAAIASATGTARIPTQGSWRPLVISSISSPCRLMVRRGVVIELVGLTENRTTIGCPVLIPPRMPPAWFDSYSGPSAPMTISSAFASPVRVAAAMPSPISTPFTALIDIIAAARSVSNLA